MKKFTITQQQNRLHLFISILVLSVLFSGMPQNMMAQETTNKAALLQFAQKKKAEYDIKKAEAIAFAKANNIPLTFRNDSIFYELQEVIDGVPQYYKTNTLGGAITSRVDKLWPAGGCLGLSLTGQNEKPGLWDVGKPMLTHQELTGRVTNNDGAAESDHSTHTASIIIASGIDANAKGMAYEAQIDSWDWTNDESEMATAAAAGLEVSNHSYGYGRGWEYDGSNWTWYGDSSIDPDEDYRFGFYDSYTQDWDEIAYDAPNYLIVKSAGNDKGDYNGTGPQEPDGGADGYDCLPQHSVAKNILTVGGIVELKKYEGPGSVVLVSYSSCGPADDGRIKPDIVTKSNNVYCATNSSANAYTTSSGTSFSAPMTTGAVTLLQQHYGNTHANATMRASTAKALVLATADEAGENPGPDYRFGWGLLNAEAAAKVISEDAIGGEQNVIDEISLAQGGTYTRTVYSSGTGPLKVTICWTDPAGTPVAAQLDPTDAMLVNDLDLRITKSGTTYYPWSLDVANPSAAATQSGENNVDNVEQVYIANPTAGSYTITVDHDGTLSGGSQYFSIVITGIDEYQNVPDCVCEYISPATDGATGLPLTTVIEWEAVENATSYDLYFGTDNPPTNIVNGTNQTDTKYGPTLSSATTYYYKVVPRNNAGSATSCTVRSFTTETPTIISTFPWSEDFDGFSDIGDATNDWFNATDDDFNWTVWSGSTPSAGTGPDNDHTTGNGKYLYTEASDPNNPARADLYTPYFDMSSLATPNFVFWYHMLGSGMGDMFIDIYDDGEWHMGVWHKSGQQSSSGTDWLTDSIDLTNYTNGNIQQIRFRGVTNYWDSDMAIDDVSIKHAPAMTLGSLTTVQGPTTVVIPGSTNQEIIRVEITTTGYNAALSATSFAFNTRGTIDPYDIQNARLYYTGTSNSFATDNQVGSVVVAPNDGFSINPSEAEGSLNEGTNYFWLTYDIVSDATQCYYIDAECNSVTINSTSQTPTVQAPAGERQVEGVLFFDDFETDLGWVLSGEFERDLPQGLGGDHGNPDPSSAFSGSYVLGSDLTGLGSNSGDYEANIGDRAYQAVSPVINCTGASNVHLTFKQWLNVERPNYDHAYIDVWDGTAWVQKYANAATITNSSWQSIDIDVSTEADNNAGFKVRFSVGTTDGYWFYSGWNIDDVKVNGTSGSCPGIPGLWTGNSSSDDWNTAGNWDDNNVPGATIDVIVPNRGYLPLVNETTACNDLRIQDGGTLTCGAGGSMTVNGSFYTGQGKSGTFNMNDGSCSISGNFHSEIGSHVNVSGGTLGFVDWRRNSTSGWGKGNIHLSGGTLNASGTVYFSLADVNGIMDGPFNFNIGGSIYINDIAWPTVTGGTITMTGSGTHHFVPSNISYNAVAYNVVLSGGGTYIFARSDGTCGWDVKNDLDLSNGTLETTNTETNSYFDVVGNVNIGNSGIFKHGAFSSTIGGALNIGAGTGGSFTIDANGDCTVGQGMGGPAAPNAVKPVLKKPDETLKDSTVQ
jgi:hypothetical protein